MADYKKQIQMALSGNEAALWPLYTETVSRVYYSVLCITDGSVDASELTASAYRLAFENLRRLTYPETFPIWIDRISVYLAYDAAAETAGTYERGRITEFLRGFHKMSDREIAQLMRMESAKLPAAVAETKKTAEDYLADPDVVMKIWEQIRTGRTAEHSGAAAPESALSPAAPAEDAILLASEYLYRRKRAVVRRVCLCVLTVLLVLSAFGFRGQSRSHDDLREVDINSTDPKVQQFARLISSQLSGQVGEIIQISDDTYYVSINLGGTEQESALVRYDEGSNTASVIASGKKQMNRSELNELAEDSYMQVLFNPLKEGAGVSSGAALDAVITAAGTGDLIAQDNTYILGTQTIETLLNNARSEQQKLSDLFGTEDADAAFSIMLRINCRNVDLSRPMTLVLDSGISKAIGEAGGVQIVLNDMRHCIEVSRAQLTSLCETYGAVTLRFRSFGEKRYEINFIDTNGAVIPELFGAMTFTLPADGPLTYVFATYVTGTENRGGIYDDENGTIKFPVTLSGTYEMLGSEREVSDIAAMDGETQKAAQFLVALQFMQLDGAGRFHPEDTVTRNEAVAMLGRMFLPTDDRLSGGFPDVDRSDPAYDYISSGMRSDILMGWSDGTFRGESEATREELLVMCGRTLLYRMGEKMPAEPEEYLDYTDAGKVSGYAQETVALMVRSGLLEQGGALRPRDKVTRGETAVLLYRMYCYLYGIADF